MDDDRPGARLAGWARPTPKGAELVVRLTPRSAVDRLDGVRSGADGRAWLSARVRAVPEKGLANKALERLLADAFGLPRGAVRVTGGATSRLKTVALDAGRPEADRILADLAARFVIAADEG